LPNKRADRPTNNVSEDEIGHLVSAALNDALAALKDRDPETFLHLRACKAREALREILPTVRRERKNAETAIKEYHKAIAFQNIELDLALTFVSSFRRYARVSQCAIPDQPTGPLTKSNSA
jgi:hypothetical protein